MLQPFRTESCRFPQGENVECSWGWKQRGTVLVCGAGVSDWVWCRGCSVDGRSGGSACPGWSQVKLCWIMSDQDTQELGPRTPCSSVSLGCLLSALGDSNQLNAVFCWSFSEIKGELVVECHEKQMGSNMQVKHELFTRCLLQDVILSRVSCNQLTGTPVSS